MNVVTTDNLPKSSETTRTKLTDVLKTIEVPVHSPSSVRWLKTKQLLHADWIAHGFSGVLLNWIKRVTHYSYKHGIAVLLVLLFNTATLLPFALIFHTWIVFYIGASLTVITFLITIILDNHESGVASWTSGIMYFSHVPVEIWEKKLPTEVTDSISKIIRYDKTHSHTLMFEAEEMLLSVSGTTRMDPAPEQCNSPVILWVVDRFGDNINGFKSERACIGIIH